MLENKEELKSLLMKVKEKSENAHLKKKKRVGGDTVGGNAN